MIAVALINNTCLYLTHICIDDIYIYIYIPPLLPIGLTLKDLALNSETHQGLKRF